MVQRSMGRLVPRWSLPERYGTRRRVLVGLLLLKGKTTDALYLIFSAAAVKK
jgi:tRNA(Glu) U13 pseudouridine synthase TruD